MKQQTPNVLDYKLKIVHKIVEDVLELNRDGSVSNKTVKRAVTKEYDLTENDAGVKYDLTARVTKSTTFGADNFELTIINLDKNFIRSIDKQRLALEPSITVKLSVKGSTDNAYYEIINKEAVEVLPSKEAGIKTQTKIYGYSGSSTLNAYSNVNFKDSTLSDVVKKLANDAGMTFENKTTTDNLLNKEKSDFIFGNDSIFQHLSKITTGVKNNNASLFIDNNNITVLENTQYRKKHIVTSENLKSTPTFPSNIITVSLFLYPAINVGDLLEIKDDLNTAISGTYTVINCEHRFDYFKEGKTGGTTNVDLLGF
jgi:hypothetical protein